MFTVDKTTGLTSKQEAFCQAVVKASDGNASAAYRKIYDTKTSNRKIICNHAHELLKKPKIAARIAALRAAATKQQELSIERVLAEVQVIAFVDPLTLFDAGGNVLPMKDIPEDTRRAIASFEVLKNGNLRVKLCEKTQALERLMRFLGMFEKDNAQRASPFDGMPRELKKEIEECLLEITRAWEAEEFSASGSQLSTH
jgi:phage terminase small subunit